MRIAHVVPTYLPATRYGGPIYSVHGLCRALAQQGHDVHVYTTSVDGQGDSDVSHRAPVILDGVSVRYFRSRWARRIYYAPSMLPSLRAAIRQYDVVHLHSVYLWPTNAAARACEKARVPYVLSPRGMLVPELIAERSRFVKTAWLRLIEARTVKHASRMHYTSDYERREATRVFPGLSARAACCVPNGVDTPTQMLAQGERCRVVASEGPYCLFLGRLSWKKGIDRLIVAVAGTGIMLVICGNDEESYTPTLRALAAKAGVADQVQFVEPAYGDDKWALLAGARMLALASLSENFGNVIPEAMAMGCPVVTTRDVGASEILEAAQGGLVCGADADALRSALLRLWSDDALHASMSASGAAYVEQRLRWSHVAERMVECYAAAAQQDR